jgi:hypothetical protein
MILSPPLWIILTSKFLFLSFYLSALLCFFLSKKTLENLLLWAIIGHFSYFIFNTGAHENHLILSVALGMAASCVNNKYLPLAIGLALISTLNMFVFYGTNGFGPLILSNKIDLIFSQCQAIWGDISSSCNAEFSKLRYSYNFPSEFSMFKDGYPYDIKLALAIFNVTYFLTLWGSNIKNTLISARNNQ